MKSLKFFKPALASTHYLFVALLFASFAVASVSAANLQRRIIIDYTTEPILCAFNEQVELHGTILISFKKKGKKGRSVTASLQSFQGVGLTSKRQYVADTVTLFIFPPPSSPFYSHGWGLLLSPPPNQRLATVNISVTGKHPTDLNSATGDPLPGQDVHFHLQYVISWSLLNGRVTRFIPDALGTPDGRGVYSCN